MISQEFQESCCNDLMHNRWYLIVMENNWNEVWAEVLVEKGYKSLNEVKAKSNLIITKLSDM